jgi:hypothetical protein
MDWNHPVRERGHWRPLMIMLTKNRVPQKAGHFSTNWAAVTLPVFSCKASESDFSTLLNKSRDPVYQLRSWNQTALQDPALGGLTYGRSVFGCKPWGSLQWISRMYAAEMLVEGSRLYVWNRLYEERRDRGGHIQVWAREAWEVELLYWDRLHGGGWFLSPTNPIPRIPVF